MYKLCNFSKAESLIPKLDFFFFFGKRKLISDGN